MDIDKTNLETLELAKKKLAPDPRTDKEMADSYEVNNSWVVMEDEDE